MVKTLFFSLKLILSLAKALNLGRLIDSLGASFGIYYFLGGSGSGIQWVNIKDFGNHCLKSWSYLETSV